MGEGSSIGNSRGIHTFLARVCITTHVHKIQIIRSKVVVHGGFTEGLSAPPPPPTPAGVYSDWYYRSMLSTAGFDFYPWDIGLMPQPAYIEISNCHGRPATCPHPLPHAVVTLYTLIQGMGPVYNGGVWEAVLSLPRPHSGPLGPACRDCNRARSTGTSGATGSGQNGYRLPSTGLIFHWSL